MFLPNLFLFYLYNQNRLLNHLLIEHVLIVAVVFALMGIVIFSLSIAITRSVQGALIVVALFWLVFWTFGHSYAFALKYSAYLSQLLWFIFLSLILGAIATFLRLYFPSFYKVNVIFRIMAVCLCMLFFFNMIPALNHDTLFTEGTNENPEVRQDFNVSPELPRPDIFWFHMDGMMSLATMERLFDQPQDALRAELEKRGFIGYEDAFLTSSTMFSLVALFNPDFYDSFLNTHLEETQHLYGMNQLTELTDRFSSFGIDYNIHINPYHEMLTALKAADYDVILVAPAGSPHKYAIPHHRIYDVLDLGESVLIQQPIYTFDSDNEWHNFLLSSGNLIQLLTLTTPLSIFSCQLIPPNVQLFSVPFHEEKIYQYVEHVTSFHSQNVYRLLIDSLTNPMHQSPKFVFLAQYYTHTYMSWIWGTPWREMSYMDGYPLSFDAAAATMLNGIDIILEHNPNAIIVLQADHGFHPQTDWNQVLNSGVEEKTLVELSNSVFSAVRIPSVYGGLDAPIAPLNISRELVNRFVGENYTLLP